MGTDDILLSQAIEGFLIARNADGYSFETINQYRWGLNKITFDKPLKAVTIDDLRSVMAAAQHSNLSPASVYAVHKSISALFTWCSQEDLITARPDKKLLRPKVAQIEVQPFALIEIKALMKAIDRTAPSVGKKAAFTMPRPSALRDKAILNILIDTGVRVSELCRLQYQDVDLEQGLLIIKPFGSGAKSKSRHVPIGKTTRKALWLYLTGSEYRATDSIWKTKFDNPINRMTVLQLLHRLGEKAKVPGVHPHRFRHTFAVQYLRNGGDIFTLQRILGHSTLDMVRYYLTLADSDSKDAHRRASPVDNWKL